MQTFLVNSTNYNLDKIDFETYCRNLSFSQLPTYFHKYNIDKQSYYYVLYKEHKLRNFLNSISNCKVIVYSALEPTTEFSLEFFINIQSILIENNIKLEIWLGNWDDQYNDYFKSLENITCVNWNKLVQYLSYNLYASTPFQNQTYSKLFCNLNNKQRYHRCCLIDNLVKFNLIEHGYVSWLQTQDADTSSFYDFKYFKEQQIVLDSDTIKSTHPVIARDFLSSSLINLIGEYTESEKEVIDISEKTWLSILYEKPFLALASKNYYKTLKDLGFLLYDELFDYSFDSLDTIEERVDSVVNALHDIKNIDYNLAYLQLSDKIKYNKQHLLKSLQSSDELMNKFYSYTVQDKETNLIIAKFKYHKQRGLV